MIGYQSRFQNVSIRNAEDRDKQLGLTLIRLHLMRFDACDRRDYLSRAAKCPENLPCIASWHLIGCVFALLGTHATDVNSLEDEVLALAVFHQNRRAKGPRPNLAPRASFLNTGLRFCELQFQTRLTPK